jgi:hypothetical protein
LPFCVNIHKPVKVENPRCSKRQKSFRVQSFMPGPKTC